MKVNDVIKCSLLCFLVGIGLTTLTAADFKRGCYFTNWSQYRSGQYKYLPENIDPYLCTHIFYAFMKLNFVTQNIEPYEWNDHDLISRILKLKERNPALKVYVVIGGWTAASTAFSPLVSTDASIEAFARNVIPTLRSLKVDGLDIDWEYPGATEQGSFPSDKQRFTSLLKILRSEFTKESQTTGKPSLDLIIATASNPWFANRAYEFQEIHKYLDFINVMTYDLAGSWLSTVQHHSALNRATSFNSDWDMVRGINFWTNNGVPANKLVLGLATYSRNFRISSNSQHTPGTQSFGVGGAGPVTMVSGFLAYYEICQFITNNGWTSVWISDQKVPYAYGRLSSSWNWAGYDSPRSLTEKVGYAKSAGLAGVFVWSLDFDDFSGSDCGQGKYPLLTAIKNAANGGGYGVTTATTTRLTKTTSASTSPTTATTTSQTTTSPTTSATTTSTTTSPTTISTTTTTSTTTSPTTSPTTTSPTTTTPTTSAKTSTTSTTITSFQPTCGSSVYIADPTDCRIFYHCSNGMPYKKNCPMGLVFDPSINNCNWPYLVPGCSR